MRLLLRDFEEMIAKKIKEVQQRNKNRDLSVT
jgi:hypothetical protein